MGKIFMVLREIFGRRWLQYVAAFTCTISMFISGMEYVWPSPSLPQLYSPTAKNRLTPDEGSWLASFSPFGDLFGAPFASFTADYFGHKKALMIAVVPYLIAWIITFSSQSLPFLLLARWFVGFGDGQNFTIIPMYIAEVADYDIRGRLGNLITVMADLGTLFMYCVGPYVSIRIMGLIGAVFPILMLITFIKMPESPYQYLTRENYVGARKSLQLLRGTDDVDEELLELTQVVHNEMSQPSTWKELFTCKSNVKALLINVGLKTAQQLSGISAFLVYSELIFSAAGGSVSPSISAIIFGFVQLLSSTFSAIVVDYVGRKPLLISSCIGSAMALFAQGTYFYLQQKTNYDMSTLGWLPLVSMIIFIVMYCYGLGAIVFMIPGEMFPTNVKTKALCLMDLYFAFAAFVVMKLFQVVSSAFGDFVPFYCFTCFTILSAFFIYYCVPETKGRTLDEIQDMLKDPKSKYGESKRLISKFQTYSKISSESLCASRQI